MKSHDDLWWDFPKPTSVPKELIQTTPTPLYDQHGRAIFVRRQIGFGGSEMKKHPGFKAVQAKIASRSGVSMKRAGAILASATRKASPAAHRANPRLNRVKGK